MNSDRILIIDCASQYSQLIARTVRELGVYSEILFWDVPIEKIKEINPSGIIITGDMQSLYERDAPNISKEILSLDIPIFGIGYGMTLIAKMLGGKIKEGKAGEYKKENITIKGDTLLSDSPEDKKTVAWLNYCDEVTALPTGYKLTAHNEAGLCLGFESEDKRISAVQFHPEAVQTENGKDILSAFIFDICSCNKDWTLGTPWVDSEVEKIKNTVGSGRVIGALSGGVDSTVSAVITSKAVGDNLHCIFVDHGMLRKDEGKQVMETYRSLNLNVHYVNAEDRFLSALSGVTEPEKKRKIIGELFIRIFEEEANKLGGAEWLLQGTIYPDIVESGRAGSAVIKSHHNVGGLPEDMKMGLIEPLKSLFKDEVRAIGRTLGIESHFLDRHPFPGPGLGVRCLGELKKERLDTLREADAIFIEEIRKAGLYDEIWQAYCALLPIRSVGVTDKVRTYGETIVMRAVASLDAMTAEWVRLPYELLNTVSERICAEVAQVNRVVYDVSNKPPATIEWE